MEPARGVYPQEIEKGLTYDEKTPVPRPVSRVGLQPVRSRHGCQRVIRYAFELARQKGKTLTNITKSNALNYSMVFWDEMFQEVAKEYPDVKI